MSGGLQCTICLEDLKSPVVTPCGHMQCEACLKAYITASKDPIKALCPTCRTPFPVVTPDLEYVPRKYHMFINASIRRVYIDAPEDEVEELREQVAQLESNVASLRRDKARLMDRCDAAMASSSAHAAGEQAARKEAQAAQRETENMKRKYEAMKKKYQDLKAKHAESSIAGEGVNAKRNRSQAFLDTTISDTSFPPISDSPPNRFEIVNNRQVVRPPKRLRVSRNPYAASPMRDASQPDPLPVFRPSSSGRSSRPSSAFAQTVLQDTDGDRSQEQDAGNVASRASTSSSGPSSSRPIAFRTRSMVDRMCFPKKRPLIRSDDSETELFAL